ncbi:uncharacterized protein DNG_04056 [Cephalotrichum gorgonifer]|uniref:Uncharacterized protein n=1 Tax=Cephalotrichum gorgonifer TaxID=2041049 RepID=A0AAE8MX93_9PEZI|nr:uncharacterized protein DNG_04056 [Cephalotrichum gorgonifer]
MGRHKAHARFDRAEWRLRFLIPLWLLQTVLAIITLIVFGWRLSGTMKAWKEADEDTRASFPSLTVAWECVNLALGVVAPTLVAYEVFSFVQETLTPRAVMLTQFVTTACATTALALDIFAHIQQKEATKYTAGALVIGSVFLVSSLGTALYALRSHRRLAAYAEISGPTNTKPYGFTDLDTESQYRPRAASHASLKGSHPDTRRFSAASSILSIRRLSAAGPPPAAAPVPLQGLTPSVYNHARDTQFDEYVSARHSADLRDFVDGSQRADFGWGGRASSVSTGDDLGTVHSEGHSLAAVPEEERALSRAGPTPAPGAGSRLLDGDNDGTGIGSLPEIKIEKTRKNPAL